MENLDILLSLFEHFYNVETEYLTEQKIAIEFAEKNTQTDNENLFTKDVFLQTEFVSTKEETESEIIIKQNEDRFSGLEGLINIGNTCYMNSILQCLNKSRVIYGFFSDNNLLEREEFLNKQPVLLNEFTNIMNELSFGQESIKPEIFKQKIGEINPKFSRDSQEDSFEFFAEILKAIDRDLQKKSWVLQNLSFEVMKIIECLECHHQSQVYENLFALPLPLFGIKQPLTLKNCLDSFFLTETILQTCKKCQKKTKTMFSTSISHLPNVCVFHLQRMTPFLTKIEDLVQFPIENLDLGEYLTSTLKENEAKFDLYAICNHLGGSPQSGHYITSAKHFKNQIWYGFNDSNVKPLAESTLINKNNYILFYEKRDPK